MKSLHSLNSLWRRRFFESTRGRVLALLRHDESTVDELAARLGLTDNAIRAQLTALERDGLVEQRGVRRAAGAGKPAFAYGLTAEAGQLFPQSYAAVLGQMVAALDARMPAEEKGAVLRDAGRRLATVVSDVAPAADADPRARLEAAATALDQIGGLARVEERDGALDICGQNCPLAYIVPEHPEVCQLAEAFASEVAGLPLREHCDRSHATPHCQFALIEPR